MNKVYKVIWSKVKNCYVVVSELAKSKCKAPKSSFFSKTLIASVLACVISSGVSISSYAVELMDAHVQYYQAMEEWCYNNGFHFSKDNSVFNADVNANIRNYFKENYNDPDVEVNLNYMFFDDNNNVCFGGSLYSRNRRKYKSDSMAGGYSGEFIVSFDELMEMGSAKGLFTNAYSNQFLSNYSSVNHGVRALAKGNNSVALGTDAVVNEDASNSIALGSGSVVNTPDAVSVGNDNLKRKIVNVAEGIISADSSEAVTGSQLLDDKANIKLNNIDSDGQSVVKSLARQSVQLEDGNHTAIAYRVNGDNYIYKVNVKDDGQVAEGNTDLVTGGTVYNAIQNAMSGIDIPDDGAVSADSEKLIKGKVVYNEVRPSDGNYVRQSNTTAQNLSALDTKVKNVENVMTENFLNVGATVEQQADLLDGLRTDLDSVSSSVDTLQQNYDTIQGNVGNIQTSVNALSGRTDALETNVQGLTTRTASLEGNVSSIEGRTAALETGLSDIVSKTGNLETTIGGMQSNIDLLNTDVSGLKQDMSGVQSTVTGLQTDVGTLQDDMTDVKSNVSGLQTDMNTVKEDVTGIHTEITGIKDNVNAVVSDVNDVKTTLGTVQSDVNGMKDDFVVMQSDIETVKNDVQSVQGDVAGIKEDVASVQSDITALQQEKANADGSNIDVDKWLEKIAYEAQGLMTNEMLKEEVRPSEDGFIVRKDVSTGDNLLALDGGLNRLKEDIKNQKTHGIAINSKVENDTNYNGEGAKGDNSMAFGVNAEAQGEDSIAIGHGAKAHGNLLLMVYKMKFVVKYIE